MQTTMKGEKGEGGEGVKKIPPAASREVSRDTRPCVGIYSVVMIILLGT